MNFIPCPRMACACRPTRSSRGPCWTEFHGLALLFHMEKPSWCSATGPANRAPAVLNSCAQAFGSQLTPWEASLGANCTNLPDLSRAPSMKLWYGHRSEEHTSELQSRLH